MKPVTILIGLIALVWLTAIGSQAQAASQSYTISVHIPSIAGVNVDIDDPTAEIRPSQLPQDLKTDVRRVVRENKQIVLRTVLVR